MEKLIENQFLRAELDQQKHLLSLEWKPDTSCMSDEEYQTILMTLAEIVETYRVELWLGDTHHFSYVIAPHLQEWTATTFNMRVAATGLKKMALIIPNELIVNLAVEQTVDDMEATCAGAFQVQYFGDTEQAMQWLLRRES